MFDRFRNSDDEKEEDDEYEEKVETETTDVIKYATNYQIEVEYVSGETRQWYVIEYEVNKNYVVIYDEELYLREYYSPPRRMKDISGRRKAVIGVDCNGTTIVSYDNVNYIDIEERRDIVFVCEDVEIEVTYRDYGDGWEEEYVEFEKDEDRDYEIVEWMRDEWKEYDESKDDE